MDSFESVRRAALHWSQAFNAVDEGDQVAGCVLATPISTGRFGNHWMRILHLAGSPQSVDDPSEEDEVSIEFSAVHPT